MSNYFNTLPDEISRHVYKYINPIKTYTRHLNNLKKRDELLCNIRNLSNYTNRVAIDTLNNTIDIDTSQLMLIASSELMSDLSELNMVVEEITRFNKMNPRFNKM